MPVSLVGGPAITRACPRSWGRRRRNGRSRSARRRRSRL